MNDLDALDLDSLVEATTADYVVKHPITGEPTAARILIAGAEHALRKAGVFSRMRARREELQRTGKVSVDPADDDADQTAFIATCTLGWSNLNRGGAPLVYTAEAALPLFADPRFRWLRDQVLEALDQRELFITGSAKP